MRIAVGMSGGVDSAMAAVLLIDQGHEVMGLTMQIWDSSLNLLSNGRSACYGPDESRDIESARTIAAQLGISHYTFPLVSEYRKYVLDYFRQEYLAGRTPNPCVKCNRLLKFGFLLSKAREAGLDFDCFATGHYARVEHDQKSGRVLLKRGMDATKDQSYFLAHLTQEQLRKVCFPLGILTKDNVRQMARRRGFQKVADQPESQDFFGCRSYVFLFKESEGKPGPIMNRQGHILGEHRGIIHYTIGQRKKLGLSGNAEPLYVIAIDAHHNALIVGSHDDLLERELVAVGVNWIAIDRLKSPISASVRIRQQHKEVNAVLMPLENGSVNMVRVLFDAPQMAVTPGQVVVFYRDDTVLGGGWIADRVHREGK